MYQHEWFGVPGFETCTLCGVKRASGNYYVGICPGPPKKHLTDGVSENASPVTFQPLEFTDMDREYWRFMQWCDAAVQEIIKPVPDMYGISELERLLPEILADMKGRCLVRYDPAFAQQQRKRLALREEAQRAS